MASTRTGLLRTAAAHVLSALSFATNRLRRFSVPPAPDLLRLPNLHERSLRDGALALPVFLCLGLFLCPALSGTPPSRFSGVVAPLPTSGITLSLPSDMTVDLAGNIYIADTGNSRIVKISPQGIASVLTISGLSTALSFPTGIALDASGILYIADSGNNRIVLVSTLGAGSVLSTTGVTLSSPQGVALDPSGNIFIADTNNNRIVKVTAAGVASVFSITGLGTSLNTPTGLAVDASGNLYIADSVNSRIVTVAAAGTAGSVLSITGLSTALDTPRGVAVDRFGNIYVADTNNNRVVTVTRALVGSALSSGAVTLSAPKGVAVDAFGTVYIADTGDSRSVIASISAVGFGHLQMGTSSGSTQTLPFTVNAFTTLGAVKAFTVGTENLDFTVAAGTTCTAGVTNTTCTVDVKFLPVAPGLRRGAVVLYDNSDPQVPQVTVPLYGFSDAPVAALAPNTATLISTSGTITYYPFQLALDGAGNIYVGNYVLSGSNPKLVKISSGAASVMATPGVTLGAICGVALDGAGNLFLGDHGNERIIVVTPGGVASVLAITGITPELGEPTELAFDAAGNLFIADYSPSARIVQVSSLVVAGSTSSGVATVLPTGSYTFSAGRLSGVAVGVDGTVYVASGTDNTNHIVQVTPSGVASLLNPAGFSFLNPQGTTVDGMGNLYVADSNHNRVVEITTAGVASVVSVPGLSSPSTLSAIYGITVDAFGNVYIPDWTNNRIVYLSVAGSSLAFANTKVGLTSTDSPRSATLTNLGNQSLVFASDPTYTADFSENNADSNLCSSSTTLSPGTVCNLSVNFTPQSVGSLSTNITVTNNTLNVASSAQQVAASGTGLIAADSTAVAVTTTPATTASLGQPLTLTAVVTDTTAGHTSTIPVGDVTFSDTLGTTVVSLNGGTAVTLDGTGTATLTAITLTGVGAHTITANYAGVTNSFFSSSNTTQVTINKAAAAVAGPAGQPIQIVSGQAGSMVVTVTGPYSGLPLPSGSLSYSILDSLSASVASGSATLTPGTTNSSATVPIANSLAAGNYTLHLTYGGDTNYAATSTASTTQFTVVDFSFSTSTGSSTSATVSAGGTASYTLAANPATGTSFPATVTFAVTGLPIGAVATFSPQTLAAGSSATNVTLAIQVPTQTASLRNSHLLALQSSTILLGMLFLPLSARIRRLLGKRTRTITVLVLAATALTSLVACNSGSTPVHQAVNYTLTVTATSGTLSHSTALTLTVR